MGDDKAVMPVFVPDLACSALVIAISADIDDCEDRYNKVVDAMRFKQSILICFGMALVFMTAGTAAAAEINVYPGDSIQDVIDTASDGDTIIVHSGTYTENMIVNKELTIISESGDPATTVVQPAFLYHNVFHVTADSVTISGFHIQGTSRDAISLYEVKECIISNNSLSNNGVGIFLYSASNNTLDNNHVSDNTYGIILSNNIVGLSSNNTLNNNNVSDNTYGIYLSSSDDNTLSNNDASDNDYGIYLSSSSYNTLNNNTAPSSYDWYEDYYGIYLSSSSYNNLSNNDASNNIHGISLYSSDDNKLSNNYASRNWQHGIGLFDSDDNTLINNTANSNSNVAEGGIGIYLDESSNNMLSDNTVSLSNDYGIGLFDSINNTLSNNIVNKNRQGIYLDTASNNTLSNNIASDTLHSGIYLYTSSNNTLKNNIASSNEDSGICLSSSDDNNIYNNKFNNKNNVELYGTNTGNVWNSIKMLAYSYNGSNYVNYTGNYYSDYAGVDSNDDGIGDTAYESRDNYPLMFWPVISEPANQPPVADANGPYEVNESTVVSFNASASYDPDGSIVSYEWDLDNDGKFDDGTGVSVTYIWNDTYSGEVSVKVTDNESSTDIDTTTVTVNNVAPTVNAVGDTINENYSATVSGTISDPGINDTFDVIIDWGDGSNETVPYPAGSTGFSEIHQYPDDDPTGTSSDGYAVNVTVVDDDGGEGNATTTVTVNNVAPTVTAVGDVINETEVATVSGTISDPGILDTFEVAIDWGDGSNETFFYSGGLTVFSETHQYPDDDPTGTASDYYAVNVTVTDDDGGEGTATTIVTVNNVAPTITYFEVQPTEPIEVGIDEVYINATFTDPGSQDNHTWEIDWGDNTTSGDVTGYTVNESHIYGEAGMYTVMLTVTDDDGGFDTIDHQYMVVYDPTSGSAVGKGSFDSLAGAYKAKPGLTGVATFDFNSEYEDGELMGETVFEFDDLNFYSADYEWMMVAGHKAIYKGNGTVNSVDDYKFLISVIDADDDLFRIKIWNSTDIIYDNNVGADTGDYADPITEIEKGTIRIRK